MTPIALGITGHCELPATHHDLIRGELARQMRALMALLPHSPFTLVSSLAPGADCLAAQAARECGIELIAPLPLPVAEIEKDHQAPGGDVDLLRDLMAYAGEGCYELFAGETPSRVAPPPASGGAGGGITPPASGDAKGGFDREDRYRRASAFVAEESQILFAVWDGDWERPKSTTAYAVRSKLRGRLREFAEDRDTLEHVDNGIVIHINVSDRFAGDPGASIETVSLIPIPEYLAEIDATAQETPEGIEPRKIFVTRSESEGLIPSEFLQVLRNIDDFNADVRTLLSLRNGGAPGEEALLSSRRMLLGEEVPDLTDYQKRLVDTFAAADVLAGENKRNAHRHFTILATCVLVASLLFIFFGDYEVHFLKDVRAGASILSMLGLSAVILAGYSIYRYATRNRKRFQDRFQDYRALAEGLRVQVYWSMAGIGDSVAAHYMIQQKTELDWIRASIRTFTLLRRGAPEPADFDRLCRVAELWISSQYNYFAGAHEREERRHRRHELWFNMLAIAAISMMAFSAIVLAIIDFIDVHHLRPKQPWAFHFDRVKEGSLLIVDSLFIFAGLGRVSSEVFALEHHVKQYAKMRSIYFRANQRFREYRDRGDVASMRRLFKDLGKMALAENGEWLLLHRERRLEMDPHL